MKVKQLQTLLKYINGDLDVYLRVEGEGESGYLGAALKGGAELVSDVVPVESAKGSFVGIEKVVFILTGEDAAIFETCKRHTWFTSSNEGVICARCFKKKR